MEWNAPHPNWELYQVICGEVRLTTPDETVTAKTGELLRVPPYCTHTLEVLTDECELADMGCSIRLLNLLEDLRSMENAGKLCQTLLPSAAAFCAATAALSLNGSIKTKRSSFTLEGWKVPKKNLRFPNGKFFLCQRIPVRIFERGFF